MYAVGIRFNVCTVGHFSAARPLKISEASSHALKSLAAHWSSWNGRGPHDPWDLLRLFWFSSSFTLEHWLQIFEPLILFSFFRWVFLRRFLGQLWLNVLIYPRGYPGHLEKTREWVQNGTGLRKRVKMDGNDGSRRRGVGREEVYARQRQGRGSYGEVSMGKRSLGGFRSPWHIFWTLADRGFSSFPPGHPESTVP